MPFQPINYAAIEPMGNPFLRNLGQNLMQSYKMGMELRQMPEQQRRQAQREELMNSLEQLKLNQEPQRFETEMQGKQFSQALQDAQAKKLVQQSEMPFGGQTPPGEIGQAMWLNMIKNKYGEGSPEFLDAKARYEADIAYKKSTTDRNLSLSKSVDKRSSTSLGKAAQELEDVQQGFMPGTDRAIPLTPEQQQVLVGQYQLKMQKDVSDSDTRKRALFASNVDKTLEGIDPKSLTQYSGAKGQVKLKADQLQSSLGKPSNDFKDYNKSLTLSNLLAKQVRQFYGDSITPQIQEKLAMLTNPSSWINDPEIAIQNFNTFKDILQKETETYRGPLRNVDEFRGKKENSDKPSSPPPGAKIRKWSDF